MTRIRMNPDGTRVLLSWSSFGTGDADEALRLQVAKLEELNRLARAEWDSLTPEEREHRTQEFHRRQATQAEMLEKLFSQADPLARE